MRKIFSSLVLAVCIGNLPICIQPMFAQGTAFTYQGQLQNSGSPANGNYDFTFALFNTNSTNAGQMGSTLADTNVGVTNGLFTVALDFGSVFTGNAAWLAIGVRTNGGGSFTTLNPLQSLTPTPYAIYAPNAGAAASANSVAGSNVVGTIAAAQLPGSVITNGASGVNITGAFTGNGGGLTNLSGASLGAGTVSGAQLAAGVLSAPASIGGTSVAATPNTGYAATNASLTTLVLPGTANVGDVVNVEGAGAGAWQVEGGIGVWVQQTNAPSTNWWSVASSSDGTHLVAVVYDGRIYTSVNSGTNWTQQTGAPSTNWYSVASSLDGTHLVAIVYQGGIYTSVNSGTNWTQQNSAPFTYWGSVASSSDGTHLVAVAETVGIYTSVNSGTNWTLQPGAPSEGSFLVASSSDGTHLVAVANDGGIYTSVNSGTNWTQQPGAPSTYWASVASSADGTRLVAISGPLGIYTSVNSGTNWTQQTGAPSESWQSVASSGDGTHLVAVANYGGIYASVNSGTNWTQQTSAPSTYWYAVASSSDGTHLVALVQSGGIYTYAPPIIANGAQGASAQLEYVGNGQWEVVTAGGEVALLNANQTFTGVNTFAGGINGNGVGLTNLNGANVTGNLSVSNINASGTINATASGTANFSGGIYINSTNGYHQSSLGQFEVDGPGIFGGRLLVTTAGNVGINNNNPGALLVVGGGGSPAYCNGTTWQNGSDRNIKRGFQPINDAAILDKVLRLPITEWQYKSEGADVQHIGPMAQDFHTAFGVNGGDATHISTVDEGGVALAAIQGLNQKLEAETKAKDAEIEKLKAKSDKVDSLERQNDSLAARLNELEAAVKGLAEKK